MGDEIVKPRLLQDLTDIERMNRLLNTYVKEQNNYKTVDDFPNKEAFTDFLINNTNKTPYSNTIDGFAQRRVDQVQMDTQKLSNIYDNINNERLNKLSNQAAELLFDSGLVSKSVSNMVIFNDLRTSEARAILVNSPSIQQIIYNYKRIPKNKTAPDSSATDSSATDSSATDSSAISICDIFKQQTKIITQPLWPRNKLLCLNNDFTSKELQERYKAHILLNKEKTRLVSNTKKQLWSKAHKSLLSKRSELSNTEKYVGDNNKSCPDIINKSYHTRQSNVPGFMPLSYNRQVPLIIKNRKTPITALSYNFNNYTNIK